LSIWKAHGSRRLNSPGTLEKREKGPDRLKFDFHFRALAATLRGDFDGGEIVDSFTPRMLTKAIARNPRTSVQDALLMFVLMLAALLLALQYDLFYFMESLSEEQLQISIAEAIFLTTLLTACLFAFVLRRLNEQRSDASLRSVAEVELRHLTALAVQDPLTGLLNRRALMEALTAAVKAAPSTRSISWI
jgi:hypothetical protein